MLSDTAAPEAMSVSVVTQSPAIPPASNERRERCDAVMLIVLPLAEQPSQRLPRRRRPTKDKAATVSFAPPPEWSGTMHAMGQDAGGNDVTGSGETRCG